MIFDKLTEIYFKIMIYFRVFLKLFAFLHCPAVRAEGVESANIVGYQTVTLTPGVQAIKGAAFVTVGADELDIQDIKMNANLQDGQAQLWWWNGATYDAKAIWYTELYDAEENGLGYEGWGDFDYWMPIEKTFAPGESFWVKINDTVSPANANFTMAGQVESVSQTDQYYAIPVTPGVQQQLTNPFPTGNLSLQSIKMSDKLTDGQAQVWWWNGATYDAKAIWYTELYDAEENGLGYEGWGDFDTWMPIEKTFTNGEAFWVKVNDTVSEANATVSFPNPFYKAPVAAE